MRAVRYSLMVKSVESGPGTAPPAPNPAMAARTGNVPMDEGRAWAGDLYDEGPVTDPAAAFARFSLEGDVEAWLDRNEDGTLTAWVQDGADIYRYSDPEAWALDVDGAGMQRVDEPAPEGVDGEEVDALEETAEDAGLAEDEDDEPNPFAEEGDEDEAPDLSGDEPDEEDPEVEVPEDADELEDAATAEVAETPEEEVTGDEDPEEEPEDDEDDEEESEGDEDDEDDEDDDLPASLKLFRRTQKKHNPGGERHNQESHGNWSDGIAPGPKRSTGGSSTGGGGGRPKGAEPKKASINPKTLEHMSDEDLEAIVTATDLYDMDTMEAVAAEMDRREPDLHDRLMDAAAGSAPGSPERTAAYDSAIPDHWRAWVAHGAEGKKPPKRNKRQEIEDAYQDHVLAQYKRFLDSNNGGWFFNNKTAGKNGSNVDFDEMAFFDGRANRAQVRKYASEELLRFFADDPRKTFTEFASEHYPSFMKAAKKIGSSYLSEHG